RPALLTREVCRSFSRVVMDVFLPCLLLASIGGTLNPGTLRDSWHLVAGSALSIVLSNATAWAFGWLLMSPSARPTFRPVQMAIAFPNSLVFPLLLLDALCEQDAINSDFAGDSNECYDQATGMIFVFVACWQILFFGWGVYCLKEDNALELSLANQPTAPAAKITSRVADSAGGDAAVAGRRDKRLGVETCTPAAAASPNTRQERGARGSVEGQAFDIVGEGPRADSEDGLSSSTPSAGNGVLSLQHQETDTTVAAGRSRGHGAAGDGRNVAMQGLDEAEGREAEENSWGVEEGGLHSGRMGDGIFAVQSGHGLGGDDSSGGGSWQRMKQRAWNVVASPVIIALVAGILVCVIEPLQDMLFHNPQAFLRPLGGAVQQAVGVPTVTVSTLIMAGSLVFIAAPPTGAQTSGGEGHEAATPIWRRPGFIMGALLILLRLIAIPAALFGLFWLAKSQSSVMGENRLMHLILLVEFAMPSASLMITVLNQVRMPNTAGFLTRLLVWQFAASSITVSVWTALAINMLY
ncbi:unnamed protein product, partial [Scytosiphon promiscuus]